jgi:hypothetical protein
MGVATPQPEQARRKISPGGRIDRHDLDRLPVEQAEDKAVPFGSQLRQERHVCGNTPKGILSKRRRSGMITKGPSPRHPPGPGASCPPDAAHLRCWRRLVGVLAVNIPFLRGSSQACQAAPRDFRIRAIAPALSRRTGFPVSQGFEWLVSFFDCADWTRRRSSLETQLLAIARSPAAPAGSEALDRPGPPARRAEPVTRFPRPPSTSTAVPGFPQARGESNGAYEAFRTHLELGPRRR